MDASGEHIAKKARAPPTAAVVKQEAGAGVDCCGEGAVAVAVEAVEIQEPPQINARVEASFLHCTACLLPLKPPPPPVFKCEAAGHAVCCSCHGYQCRVCNRATTYRHSGDLDAIVGAVTVPCVYEGFGCNSYVVYHEAADHQRQCPHAPCSCPEPGCGFAGSPAATLLGHFSAAHSWPVAEVRYGKPHKLTVPLLPPQRWHVLVGADDRCLFLLSLGALGPATAVSLVCVRANAAAAPRYRCKVWAEVPSNADNLALLSSVVGISDLSCGLVAAEQGMFLTVPPDLVHEVSGETLLLLNIRIDKIRSAPS